MLLYATKYISMFCELIYHHVCVLVTSVRVYVLYLDLVEAVHRTGPWHLSGLPASSFALYFSPLSTHHQVAAQAFPLSHPFWASNSSFSF